MATIGMEQRYQAQACSDPQDATGSSVVITVDDCIPTEEC